MSSLSFFGVSFFSITDNGIMRYVAYVSARNCRTAIFRTRLARHCCVSRGALMLAVVGAIPVTGCFAIGRDALNAPACVEFKSSGNTTLRTGTPSDEIWLYHEVRRMVIPSCGYIKLCEWILIQVEHLFLQRRSLNFRSGRAAGSATS